MTLSLTISCCAALLATGHAGAAASLEANTVVMKDLPAGGYAFVVIHDANSNGKLDRNLLGKMGPPSFEQARFSPPAAGATVRLH